MRKTTTSQVGPNFDSRESLTALWKGVASNVAASGEISAPSKNMMSAKQALRMMEHQQILMKARLTKLQKEEEAANNRIKTSLRQQEFVQNMQEMKAERMH